MDYCEPTHVLPVYDGLRSEMTAFMKEKYKEINILLQYQWMTEKSSSFGVPLHIDLKMIKTDSFGVVTETSEVNLKDIFHVEDASEFSGHRILLEGGSGYGKTTACRQIVHDWVHGEEYTSNFQLMFLLQLQFLEHSLEDTLASFFHKFSYSKDVIAKGIKSMRVLVLLDGLYNLSAQEETTLQLYLESGYLLPNITMLVTSRPGILCIKKENVMNRDTRTISQQHDSNVYSFDTRIVIEGISEYLVKALYRKKRKDACAKEGSPFKLDILRAPFNALIMEVADNTESMTSTADLFEELFGKLFSKYSTLTRMNKNFGSILMCEYGELSLQCLIKESFTLKESLFRRFPNGNHFLEMGLIMKRSATHAPYERVLYEPPHISFYEFAAAHYMSSHPMVLADENVIQFLRKEFTFEKSNVLLFMASFWDKSNIAPLLDLMKSLKEDEKAGIDDAMLGEYLISIEMTEDEMNIIVPLFCETFIQSKEWKISSPSPFYQSMFHEQLLTHGINTDAITCVTWETQCQASFPKGVVIPVLNLHIQEDESLLLESYAYLCCTALRVVFNSSSHFEKGLNFARMIQFCNVSFLGPVDGNNIDLLYSSLKSGFLGLQRIRSIQCKVDSSGSLTKLIKLLARNVIEELKLSFLQIQNEDERTDLALQWKKLYELIYQSPQMKRLEVKMDELKNGLNVDFSQLSGRHKKWSQVVFEGHPRFSGRLSSCFSSEYFKLVCDSCQRCPFCNNAFSWTEMSGGGMIGHDSVKKLSFMADDPDVFQCGQMLHLTNFRNLTDLTIEVFPFQIHRYAVLGTPLCNVFQALSLTRLNINYIDANWKFTSTALIALLETYKRKVSKATRFSTVPQPMKLSLVLRPLWGARISEDEGSSRFLRTLRELCLLDFTEKVQIFVNEDTNFLSMIQKTLGSDLLKVTTEADRCKRYVTITTHTSS